MTLQLQDYEEIRQVLARYTQAADRKDIETINSGFTPDASFVFGELATAPAESIFTGHDAIATVFADNGDDAVTQHWVSGGILIEETETGAQLQAYCQVLRIAAGEAPTSVLTGMYRDQLVRVDGKWLVKLREILVNP